MTVALVLLALPWPFGPDLEHQHFDALIKRERAGIARSILIVRSRADAKLWASKVREANWASKPDIERAEKSSPFYCPSEYIVTFASEHDFPSWQVDIVSRKVVVRESMTDWIAHHPYDPTDGVPPRRCLNGRKPILLNPDLLPEDAS